MLWLNEEIYSTEVCIVVLVWKLHLFSFHLLCRSLYKSKKYQKILPTEFDQVTLFLLYQKRHWIHERPCCTICTITLEPFVVKTRTRPKEEWWHFLNPLSLWEFLLARQVVVRLKTPFSWIAENFWKFLEKKIRLRQNFIFFHAV